MDHHQLEATGQALLMGSHISVSDSLAGKSRYHYPRPPPASSVIAEARASLRRPSRPFTPAISRDGELFLHAVGSGGGKLMRSEQWKKRPVPRRLDPLDASLPNLPTVLEDSTEITTFSEPSPLSPSQTPLIPHHHIISPHASPAPHTPSTSATVSSTPHPDEPPEPDWTSLTSVLADLESQQKVDVKAFTKHPEELDAIFDAVHRCLEGLSWLRSGRGGEKRGRDKRRRDFVLHSLMRWMESSGHPVVAIGVCGILIRLTHDERVLLNTFKLLFKLSKNERNDRLFQSKRVLGSILDFMRPSSIPESQGLKNIYGSRCDLLIYAAGTLKNISNNDSNQKVLLQCGCVPHLTEVIQSILDTGDFTSVPDDQLAQATQLLIQITASLRNLASAHPFVNGNAIGALINLTHESVGLTDSSDLMLNVSRILSKLSLHSDCLEKMKGESNVQALLQLVVKYQNHKRDPQPLLVRIFFVLGNLTSVKGPEHKFLLNGLPDIAALLGIYSAVCLHKLKRVATREGRRQGWSGAVDKDANSGVTVGEVVDGDAADEVGTRIDRENMDVMVKLVRVLANLALDPECGQELVQMIEIESLVEILAHADMEREEELVLNIVGALANFTFYLDVDNCLLLQGCRILELLVPLLLCSNSEAVSEATRVFGNLSRLDESRQWMAKNKGGTELLIVLLDHSDAAVLENVCGAFANILAPTTNAAGKRVSGENGRIVVQGGGFEKIANVVEESLREEDLRVAIAASKALSNLFTISTSLLSDQLEDFISTNDEERLATILMHALESTMVKNADDDDELLKTFERIARNTLENLGYYEDEDGHALDETPPSTPPPMHPPAKRGNWVEAGVGPGS